MVNGESGAWTRLGRVARMIYSNSENRKLGEHPHEHGRPPSRLFPVKKPPPLFMCQVKYLQKKCIYANIFFDINYLFLYDD